MNKNTIAERLRALIADEKKRSKAARLRDVVDEVEAALAAGVSRIAIIDELTKSGLEMTLGTFETTLKRIRKKREKTIPQTKAVAKPTDMVPTPEPEPEPARVIPSHDPRDLDAIMNSRPDLEALAKLAKRAKKSF